MRDLPPSPSRNPLNWLFRIVELRPASDRLLLRVALMLILGSAIAAAVLWSQSHITNTPSPGGTLVEGVVGSPRFINPVLAVTRADQDVAALLFSGMMKLTDSGALVPDLAESITVAEDGLTYSVQMRTDLAWHDGTPLTARDVAFTIALLQDQDLKSPLRGNWSDVRVEEISEYELNILLPEAYTPFIENFTVGILPRHIWNTIPVEQIPFSQFNTDPIGSGPFMVEAVGRDRTGLINSYTLKANPRAITPPNISSVVVKFYDSEAAVGNALREKNIDASAYITQSELPSFESNSNVQIIEEPLPRIFTLFFNQNRSASLRDTAARQALDIAVNRQQIIESAVQGYGVPTNAPVPPGHNALQSSGQAEANPATSQAKAADILRSGGWKQNSNGNWEKTIDNETELLAVNIQTANTEIFSQTAAAVARDWRELGVIVQVDEYEQSDILQSVIRMRDFQVLLFGLDMSRSVDLYPFWHSSQREDPGLNIAQYANIEVDSLLQTARTTSNDETKQAAQVEILEIFATEVPAVFLYVPTFTYVTQSDLLLTSFTGLSRPQERFMNIQDWYRASDNVWPLFQN